MNVGTINKNRDNRITNNHFLNLLGLQCLRYLLSSLIYFIRGRIFQWNKNEYIKTLKKDGIVIIENFLKNKDFNELKKNFSSISKIGKKNIRVDGDIDLFRSTIKLQDSKKNYFLKKIVFSERIINILQSCEHRIFKNKNFYNEKNGENIWLDILKKNKSKKKNSQKYLHSDTFVNTHKAWFFLDKVQDKHGPFIFVKGSQKFSFKRMFLEYINSIIYKYPTLNSRYMNLKYYREKEYKCIVNANTIVIANTRAFHRRGESKQNQKRRQIHWQIRHEPFKKIFSKSN